jgi:uncharacterized membrane protein
MPGRQSLAITHQNENMNTHIASIHSIKTRSIRLLNRRTQLIACLIFIGTMLSSIIPPFQSPDEFDHIKRAYLLSKGQFTLVSPPNTSSGGYIDNGLLQYMDGFTHLPFEEKHTVARETIEHARQSRWQHTTNFSIAPGTGYYFPLVYLPQAAGLLIGQALDLSVDLSYRLARLLALSATLGMLFFAARIYPTNFLTLALLALPMTVFQMVSATLDGTTTALAILCISLFMRACDRSMAYPKWMSWLLGLALLLLVNSRIHLLPLLALPLVIYVFRKRALDLALCAALTLAALAWLFIAMRYTIDLRVARSATLGQIVGYYLGHPLAFPSVLWATLMDSEIRQSYQQTFVGKLGWLDLQFHDWFYNLSLLFCAAMGALSVQWSTLRQDWRVRAFLLACAGISLLLVFFLLLVTWSKHPAAVIEGVQGRYFLVPCILLAYALKGQATLVSGNRRIMGLSLLYLYLLMLSIVLPQELIYRYFAK